MDNRPRAGVLGATSFVGTCLLPQLLREGRQVTAFSRNPEPFFYSPAHDAAASMGGSVEWRQMSPSRSASIADVPNAIKIEDWICVAPVWVLPDYFALIESHGARRVVALSSTSRFTKVGSSNAEEQALSRRLADAEERLREWAEGRGIEWVILRPTLIYGLGQDRNISEIARFILRSGFFPLLGKANGLRQPVHVQDVAAACLAALQTPCAANRAYNISGGEILAYRDMVERVFVALGCRPRLLAVPRWLFGLAVAVLRCLPRYRNWSTAMAERMNQDMVFDHAEATRDLAFKPRSFLLSAEDLPA